MLQCVCIVSSFIFYYIETSANIEFQEFGYLWNTESVTIFVILIEMKIPTNGKYK